MARKSVFRAEGVQSMIPFNQLIIVLALAVALLGCPPLARTVQAIETVDNISGIRARGQSSPPFLNPGVKANLLLLIDNSGSMLDMAYTAGVDSTCFDDTYMSNPETQTYTGYYKQDAWYVWQESSTAHYEKGIEYEPGAIVVDNGIFFIASCSVLSTTGGCSSAGDTLDKDTGVKWLPATGVTTWLAGTSYPPGAFVKNKGQLYLLKSIATYQSIDNPSIDKTNWEQVDSTWQPDTGYLGTAIVTYNGMVFQAKGTVLAKAAFDWNDWQRLDEGYFEEAGSSTEGPCPAPPSYTHTFTDASGTSTALQITMVDSSDVKITDVSLQTPASVTCFAAKGNFLNWASASKFDIQKKILSGGKYYTGFEDVNDSVTTDNEDDRLISENRGCAGTGFVKQVDVSNGVKTHQLTLRVRGAIGDNPWIVQTDDRVDTTDNTTRIEILAVSEEGFNNAECNAALDALALDKSGATAKDEITLCMGYDETSVKGVKNSAFINGLIECSQIWDNKSANVENLKSHCSHLYKVDGILPSSISHWDPEYLCYGTYNPYLPTVEEREGFFGACWGLPVSADPTLCTRPAQCDYTQNYEYSAGSGVWHTCTSNIEMKCDDNKVGITYQLNRKGDEWVCSNSNKPDYNDNGWEPLYKDDEDEYCEYGGSTGTILEPDWVNDPATCTEDAANKFCGQLKVPEVIDPSDKNSTTSESYNVPAMLIDSGVMGQLNIERPLAVMKGYIKQLEVPLGVLQNHAKELRIGAMKINSVGADYECTSASTGNIEKFCPDQNKDGAELIAPLKLGSFVDTSKPKKPTHVQTVAEAINDVKANTWTPLAEAVFSAIGYFTQRSDMCLNEDTDGKCLDLLSSTGDPIQFSCQDNHLLIISEGASTADIETRVAAFAAGLGSDGDAETGTCAGGLQGSTYLDDLTGFAYYNKPEREQFTNDSDYNSAYASARLEAIKLYGTIDNAAIDGDIKKGIKTHIITSGSLRDEGDGECNPKTLMTRAAAQGGSGSYISGENPAALEDGLISTIESIIERASSGSAASVISSSRSGEGAVYQALFWPERKWTDAENIENTVSWFGDVHSLFIDSQGFLYEDTDGNGKMEPLKDLDGDGKCDIDDEDLNGDGILNTGEDTDEDGHLDVAETCWGTDESAKGIDKRVITYYDTEVGKSMGCYMFEFILNQDGQKILKCMDSVELEDIKYIWSADKWLSEIVEGASLLTNRPTSKFISKDKQRYIFTWNDLNNDGIVDDGEIISFDENTDWESFGVTGGRGSVPFDFGLKDNYDADNNSSINEVDDVLIDANVDKIVNWIRGQDTAEFRNRKDKGDVFRRLGDIIHSTPMVVAAPEEGYHLLYNDFTYADFVARWNKRRHVVYFGANDGMLHAVNSGFYNDKEKRFCKTATCDETATADVPELGAELWAYVPYNLQPHLEFLTRPEYIHKYYVDLRPRIFDVQIFPTNEAHPNGWGTILVGGMRFGGAPVHAKELNSLESDNRVFTSAYFVLDITDPEHPPKLLGEITRTSEDVNFDNVLATTGEDDDVNGSIDADGVDLGYSTAISTMVVMKKSGQSVGDLSNKWYLMLGSGPHAYRTSDDPLGSRALKGFSDQQAKVAVLPLDYMVKPSGTKKSLRIPDADPTTLEEGGRFVLAESQNGFVSDLITIDFDINPSSADYLADAVYFGTVEANVNDVNAGFLFDVDGFSVWNGGGKLYRLVTRSTTGEDDDYHYVPRKKVFALNGDYSQTITTPDQWDMTTLMNPERPITGAPSVAFDGNNFWVYFGTGRFFDPADKTDDTEQAFYGIKEPLVSVTTTEEDEIKKFTWETAELTGVKTALPGAKGLLRVDEIQVEESSSGALSELSCRDNTTNCLPSEILDASGKSVFNELEEYIAGTGSCTSPTFENCTDGWYKKFFPGGNRERNLGQAAILGGLVTFTTYQPYDTPCLAEGESFLYGVYYKTGTAWFENIFGNSGVDHLGNVKDKLELGRGLSLTPNLHAGSDTEGDVTVFVQTSTGEILEINQEVPIENFRSGRQGWKEETQCF